MPKNPNFFPYDGAQFCRPNWLPSNKVQAFAGGLEAMQAQRRLSSQLKIDSLVSHANDVDTAQELTSRRAMLKREQDKCNCGPAEIQPRYVLQPTSLRPLALAGDSIRPGGADPLAWLNELGEERKEKVDETGDKVAQSAGGLLCSALAAAGIEEPARELAAEADAVLSFSDQNPSRAYAHGVNYTIGAIPYFVIDLLQECDFGPAIKTFAAAEARRMAVAHIVFKNIAYVSGAVGVAAAAPTGAVSLIPVGQAVALATMAKVLQAFWETIAQGRWLSWEEVANILEAMAQLQIAGGTDYQNSGFSEAVQDALELSVNVTEAQNAIQSALAQAAEDRETLSAIERAFLQIDVDAKSGRIDPQRVATQPSQVNPGFSVFPPPPNPLVVRPVLIPPDPGNLYPEAGAEAPEEGAAPGQGRGAALPLLGLGLLLELF